MKVSSVQVSRLAGLSSTLEVLEGVDLTLNGTVTGAMTLPDTIKPLELDFASGAGKKAVSPNRWSTKATVMR